MYNLLLTIFILTFIGLIIETTPQLHGNLGHGAVISSTSGYSVPKYISKDDVNIYHSSYKAPDYSHTVPLQEWDTIFNKKHDEKRLNPHDEKALRKAYNEYIDNKILLKKRIFSTIVQKTVDKTVDITASLAKYTADFLTKLGIDTAAKIAKNGAHAVIHKKEEKYREKYHH